MVLCLFVFLLLRHDAPLFILQPTEVSSTHWVSMRTLVSTSLGTLKHCDVSERLSEPGNRVLRFFLRAMFGQMLFPATQLIPAESLFCSSVPEFLPNGDSLTFRPSSPLNHRKTSLAMSSSPTYNAQRPLLLWGLTLGIATEFLHPLHSNGASNFWLTLSHWDFRCTVWLFTYFFRARKLREFCGDGCSSQLGRANDNCSVFDGSDLDKFSASAVTPRKALPSSSVRNMLDGYSNLLKKAMIMTLLLRLGFGTQLLADLETI